MAAFDAELLDVIPRTSTVSSFRFSNLEDIQFKAGQYSILTIIKDGEKISHIFSISNSPTETGYLEYTTMLRRSDFKDALRSLEVGDKVRLETPFGEFVLDDGVENIGMLAGGIGITPFRSMIKYCTDDRFETKITLLYGCRSEGDIVFKDDFELIQKENPNFKVVYTLEKSDGNWRGYKGYIDTTMIMNEIPDYSDAVFYCCGPPIMINVMEGHLKKIGIIHERIRKENFTGY